TSFSRDWSSDVCSSDLSDTYSSEEILSAGHQFFGSVAQGLASVIEQAFEQYGQPNAYILGQEGGGALFIGAEYGDGTMYTRNAEIGRASCRESVQMAGA